MSTPLTIPYCQQSSWIVDIVILFPISKQPNIDSSPLQAAVERLEGREQRQLGSSPGGAEAETEQLRSHCKF